MYYISNNNQYNMRDKAMRKQDFNISINSKLIEIYKLQDFNSLVSRLMKSDNIGLSIGILGLVNQSKLIQISLTN